MSLVDNVRTKTTATFLAKEWLELIYNIRDANRVRNNVWNCVPSSRLFSDNSIKEESVCDGYFASGEHANDLLHVSFDPVQYMSIAWVKNTDEKTDHTLSYFTGRVSDQDMFWYAYSGEGGESSIFSRYIVFTGLVEQDKTIPVDSMVKVESHVPYQKGGLQGEILLQSFIGKW